jgi:flagellar hook protein FlgE
VTGAAVGGSFPVTVTLPDGTVVTGTATSNGNVTDFTGTDSGGNPIDTHLNLAFGILASGDTTTFTLTGFDGTSSVTQSNTTNYSSSETVYDSLGTAHTVTVNFRKASVDTASQTSTWDWNATVSGQDTVASGGSGTMTFNENGVLTSGGSPQAVTFDFAGAQQNQVIDLVFGSASGEGSSTQYSSSSKTTYVGQDGYAPGVLQSVSVSQNGIISGTYDNGQILQLYQVTLANFDNPQGLKKEGGNLYSATLDSGNAYTNAPGQGGTGKISSNSLEGSNVDLATEFVKMIVAQRGYEANSKVITTTDQILQSLMNIKQ